LAGRFLVTRIDLHIHSAASITTKDKGKKELAGCDKGHVDALLRGLKAHDINMCAITDHDCFDKDLYFALKEREGDGCLNKVLPGIEFSVSIRAGGKKPTVVHIVAIFDDRHPDLIDGIAEVVCDEKGKPRYDDLNIGAFTEDGFTKVLRGIGLNAVLIGHEKSAGQDMSKRLPSIESSSESSFEELALKNEQSPTFILEGSVTAMSKPSKVGRHFRLENEISPPSLPG